MPITNKVSSQKAQIGFNKDISFLFSERVFENKSTWDVGERGGAGKGGRGPGRLRVGRGGEGEVGRREGPTTGKAPTYYIRPSHYTQPSPIIQSSHAYDVHIVVTCCQQKFWFKYLEEK